jgi:signal transduction histidine kinase
LKFSAFIVDNQQAILDEWVAHARTLLPSAAAMSRDELEDHGRQLVVAIAADMEGARSDAERSARARNRPTDPGAAPTAAAEHGRTRQIAGFDATQMHAEFRALRASVLRLWARSDRADTGPAGAEEIARFNEAVDQLLAESVERYSAAVAKSRDMFLAVLGHDLRGPLSGISVAADLLARPDLSEAARLQVAARIRRACSTITSLSTDLLEYTRSRLGGGIPVEPSPCNLAALCDEALEAIRASYPEREFVQRTSGDLATRCDVRRLQQVLWNLLDNAVHYGDPGRPVTLDAVGRADAVLLRIASFGETIPAESLLSIFEPMVRTAGARAHATGHPGSNLGLGLFIVHEIVRGHGGAVTVSSDREHGTVFAVELPRREPSHRGHRP